MRARIFGPRTGQISSGLTRGSGRCGFFHSVHSCPQSPDACLWLPDYLPSGLSWADDDMFFVGGFQALKESSDFWVLLRLEIDAVDHQCSGLNQGIVFGGSGGNEPCLGQPDVLAIRKAQRRKAGRHLDGYVVQLFIRIGKIERVFALGWAESVRL